MTSHFARLTDRIARHFLPDPPDPLGVAVSGGSDSLALLTLLKDWRDGGGPKLCAVTVDHGLRPDAPDEAAQVAHQCHAWGIPHDILQWTGWDGQGNLPDRARRARYELMAEWADGQGVKTIALGHTADDQAETFLMRLTREAGLDGLSAMAPNWQQGGVTFARPVLAVTREDLRDVLRERGLAWADDPSNDDPAYARARARKVLAELSSLDIDAATLAQVARNLTEARAALQAAVAQAAKETAQIDRGDVILNRAALAAQPAEIARRLVQAALLWISGADYPPRGAALANALQEIADGQSATLHGCRLITRPDTLRITREAAAVADVRVPAGEVWDGRWHLKGPQMRGVSIAALGENALGQCPDRRETGLPAASLCASPAVWQGGRLLAAPLAGLENGWSATLVHRENHDFAALLSH